MNNTRLPGDVIMRLLEVSSGVESVVRYTDIRACHSYLLFGIIGYYWAAPFLSEGTCHALGTIELSQLLRFSRPRSLNALESAV